MDRVENAKQKANIGSLEICAVTKNRSIDEVENLLIDLPGIKIIAENRWPDCEEKFIHFKNLEKHFIGPLQGNKVRKVVPIVDVIQSVDSLRLMKQIDIVAGESNKIIKFCFQVNISGDPAKSGVDENELTTFINEYINANFKNIRLVGLMTIGANINPTDRAPYLRKLKNLFDRINAKYFPNSPLAILSMGMSDDFEIAIREGSTMLRLGTVLF